MSKTGPLNAALTLVAGAKLVDPDVSLGAVHGLVVLEDVDVELPSIGAHVVHLLVEVGHAVLIEGGVQLHVAPGLGNGRIDAVGPCK